MKTIRKSLPISRYSSKTFDTYWQDSRIAVLDIETTGLSPRYEKVILTGILMLPKAEDPDAGMAETTLYFAEHPDEEPEVLRATFELLQQADAILTYNGRSFDLPFLKARAKKHSIAEERTFQLPHLDLFSVVSSYSDLKALIGSLKQKEIERFLGLDSRRRDEISGKESVDQYKRYVASQDKELERQILLHNYDDIQQLARILSVIRNTDFHRAMFHLGFPAGPDGQYLITQCKLKANELLIEAQVRKHAYDYINFPTPMTPYSIRAAKDAPDADTGSLEISLPVEKIQGNILILDAATILPQKANERLADYPNYESGYLIARRGDQIQYWELNRFVQELLESLDVPV